MIEWLGGNYGKIVLGVESEAELMRVHELAVGTGARCSG